MKTREVYSVEASDGTDGVVYVCRGAAKDKERMQEDSIFIEGTLVVSDDVNFVSMENIPDKVYFVHSADDEVSTRFYADVEGAKEEWQQLVSEMEDAPEPITVEWPLVSTLVPPKPFPWYANFVEETEGKYCLRINAHPDMEGATARPKRYFPDQSFGGVDEGTMYISGIVSERDAFGFLRGHKYVYPEVSEEDLCLALSKFKSVHGNTLVIHMADPIRGTYWLYGENRVLYEVLECKGDKFRARQLFMRRSRFNNLDYAIRYRALASMFVMPKDLPYEVYTFADLCLHRYDTTHMQLYQELIDSLEGWSVPFGTNLFYKSRRLQLNSEAENSYSYSLFPEELRLEVDKLLIDGVLSVYSYAQFGEKYPLFIPQKERVWRMAIVDSDDYNRMLDTVKEINSNTVEFIRNQLKSGKLRFMDL